MACLGVKYDTFYEEYKHPWMSISLEWLKKKMESQQKNDMNYIT